MFTRKLGAILLAVALALLVAQLVPYGRQHTNPPDGTLAAFDSPVTEELAKRACFDCHSNRTHWPWYASIAPMSWRIQHHVTEGREKLNFTAFDPASEDVADAAGEAGESVTKRAMPPRDYLLMHPEARLTPAESATLARGLETMFAAFVEEGGKAGHRDSGSKHEGESEKEGAERGEDRD